jgi:hypothetical protein
MAAIRLAPPAGEVGADGKVARVVRSAHPTRWWGACPAILSRHPDARKARLPLFEAIAFGYLALSLGGPERPRPRDGCDERALARRPHPPAARAIRPGTLRPPPERAARLEILLLALRRRPVADSVDLRTLASKNEGFSGADLSNLVEQAAEGPIRQALTAGTIRPIGEQDLLGTIAATRPTTKAWFPTARNYATFSNVGGLYGDLVAHLTERR